MGTTVLLFDTGIEVNIANIAGHSATPIIAPRARPSPTPIP